tara:strand:- start:111 stop:851 length:741 start_codon:yes stop_codon:yes gene_type:complete
MKDVAIVFAGNKFSNRHIEQKRRQLDKHCSLPTRLTVFTDDPARVTGIGLRDTRAVLLPDWWDLSGPRQKWWYKCAIFAGLRYVDWIDDDVLYLDLDTILTGDIAKFWDYKPGKFCILQDFNRAFIAEYPVSNSSVMRFNPQDNTEIFEYFDQNLKDIVRRFRGDQDYLTWWFKTRESYWWPRDWAMSYKWEILHGGTKHGGTTVTYPNDYLQPDIEWLDPEDCSIVVFHGNPDPWDTHFGNLHIY